MPLEGSNELNEKNEEEGEDIHERSQVDSGSYSFKAKANSNSVNDYYESNDKAESIEKLIGGGKVDSSDNYQFDSDSDTSSSTSSKARFKETENSEKELSFDSDSDTSSSTSSKARFKETENSEKVESQDSKQTDIKIKEGEIWQDWWLIKATEFLSGKKFPPIVLPNQETRNIQLSEDKFRINQTYNCKKDKHKPAKDYYFWVRLSDKALFYSSTSKDLNVLGSVEWEQVVDIVEGTEMVKGYQAFCVAINDKDNKGWKICTYDYKVFKPWYCRIKHILKMPDDNCSKHLEYKVHTWEQEIIQPEVVIPIPSRSCNQNWSYRHLGEDWECICREGVEQSPIDLPSKDEAIDSPIKPMFEYEEVGPKAQFSTLDSTMERNQNIEVINENGLLGIRNYEFGKIRTLDGSVYRAEEITFHTPSNHRIKGKTFDMEISVHHYGITKGDIAKQITLSFLFEKKAGVYNQFIDDVDLYNLPNPVSKVREIVNSIYVPKILFNFEGENDSQIISMKPFSFFTYQGSLPFPPCTESTIVYVTSEPLKVGHSTIQMFQEALRVPDMVEEEGSSFNLVVSDVLPVSNRSVQELNGRPVYHYDHTKYCPSRQRSIIKPAGHYEKMKKDVT
eukprot:CAMPEP_0170537384 /NCGR_PEP_ID=MMETSP0209-20121228/102682_1 /TAXON_ID=665100 ORGANISM="Litonotus pictus, Strain P1" /NCGR_SAMPLE_ID=MMETSP0209 /ASSEMBLY_ACC=CAM_ASM_000301 /LENGTH=619 /DNA_ID=CAMNT_0010838871 /DNA_START=343 /DNA_END=2200 /DNA_ORIENTATION=-